MSSGLPTAAARRAAQANVPSKKKLDALQKAAHELVVMEAQAQDLAEQLRKRTDRITELRTKVLPELCDAANVDRIGLPDDNADLVVRPYYKANISADWDEERKERAYQWLENHGAGDLIKVTVVQMFGKKELPRARALEAKMRKSGFSPKLSMVVPWNTLTAYVQEQIEKYQAALPLDLLGATVGKVAELKLRKEK